MSQLRLCLHTQTPFVRFVEHQEYARRARLEDFLEGRDYHRSPGGVTRMVGPLLQRLVRTRRIREASWMSLARAGPDHVRLTDAVGLEHVQLAPAELPEYAAAKEAIWNGVHGTGKERPPVARVDAGLDHLARRFAARTRRLHAARPFDAFYVHDFQLLPLADRLPSDVPRLFRWHIPVPEGDWPYLDYVVERMDRYDAVIVSTHAYAERLRKAGVRVPVHAAYPYLDEARTRVVTSEDVRAFEKAWRLRPDDVVFVVVARMEAMKSQDVAIRALARGGEALRDAKLVLVGGGGFSAGKGGLGLPKAAAWRERCEALARDLGVADRVVFTGTIPDADLDVAITRARAVLLPSRLEGFGLAAVEGWLYGRPVVVSRSAGVAELVREGKNGFTHAPGDDRELAERLAFLAREPEAAAGMGADGRTTARACHLGPGTDAVWRVLADVVERRKRTRFAWRA